MSYRSFFLFLLVSSCVLSYLLTMFFRRLAFRFSVVDKPASRKVHKKPIPMLGGCSVFTVLAVWMLLLYFFSNLSLIEKKSLLGIFCGGFLVFLVGLLDDIKNISAKTRILVEILASLCLLFSGVHLQIFIHVPLIQSLITILWIVGITNSFNLLDNMDGLSSGVAMVCALSFFIVVWPQHQWLPALLSMTLIGALTGFLFWNFNPALIFLGDAGSLFIGFLLASCAVDATYIEQSRLNHLPVLTPLFIFAVPLFDTFSVIVLRLRAGDSIFKADKRHISHRLVDMGLSQRSSVCMVYLMSFILAIPAMILYRVNLFEALLLLLQFFAFLSIVAVLMAVGRNKNSQREISS